MKNIIIQAIGSDPELFFVDANGIPRSAEGLLGGSKEKPKQMEGLPDGYMIQEDNVACEFNIPPAVNATAFNQSIELSLKYIAEIAKKNKLKLRFVPSLRFPMDQLQTEHAQTFGCDPDIDVWKLETNPRPIGPPDLRSAAGHIHISWTDPSPEQRRAVGKACDLYLGVPSILVTKPSERRQLYGKAGAVRVKPYGLEYRTLDNFWLTTRAWRMDVFRHTINLVNQINQQGDILLDALEDFGPEIQHCINDHDVNSAQFLCQRFAIPQFTVPNAKRAA